MSTASHHAEWLSLIEISGPFLSMPVLLRAFPQGLEAYDSSVQREVKLAYEEWLDNQQGLKPEVTIHTAWIRFVLKNVLELPDEVIAEGQEIPQGVKAVMAEHGETLRPDMIISQKGAKAQSDKPNLLIQVYPMKQDLEKAVAGDRRWKASPATRMMELLRSTEARLGLVTNGERWMLVTSPALASGTTGFISWSAADWCDEPLTLRAFRALLSAKRFFGVADDETLEAMLTESADDQHEITDQLGYQVRRAVEVLIQAMDRADQDRGRELLKGIPETTLYESALTVMMRLVFLLSAEERGLLLLGDPIYDQHYAVSTLRAQLREMADQFGEEVLERRLDAWCRLLATFRVVHGGVYHENMRLPAYGGSLFDPNRFPFLEGRTPTPNPHPSPPPSAKDADMGGSEPLAINNRVVLHLLEALQMLRMKVPGGGAVEARRLSFRALDVEQIGDVYEGLLDHTAVRASEAVLGLEGTKKKEPEVPLKELERLAASPKKESLIEFLGEESGRSESALRRALSVEDRSKDEGKMRAACGNDDDLFQRVAPFVGLIREDDFGMPMVIPKGSVYVTAGTDRRSSGTHYTPRSLTEPIVQHTLEPLVYVGVAEGLPRDQWKLKSAAELLQLKVCDMAMGCGTFLVQTDRYLAERLVEAWEVAEVVISEQWTVNSKEQLVKRARITPEGKLSTGEPSEQLIPDDPDERLAFARRIVADRCLYGVDKNPLAVEMAKLSLWLITLAKDKPFTFLNHSLKAGDSLVGADDEMFLRWAHGLANDPKQATVMSLFDEQLGEQLKRAREKRQQLESFTVIAARDAERKEKLLDEAEAEMARVKLGCDLIIGARLLGLKAKEVEGRLNTLLLDYMAGLPMESDMAREALTAARKVKAFHWQFVFPEVFEQGGFSAFVGNPPFMGGRNFTAQYGEDYAEAMRGLYPSGTGGADLCAYFFLRAFQYLRQNGTFGLIATNTIAQGDTRAVGLDDIAKRGGAIYKAIPTQAWPGVAAVFVSVVHLAKGFYNGEKQLDDKPVSYISPLLDGTQNVLGNPQRLVANVNKSFQGSIVLGMGFVLEPEEAHALIAKDARNKEVLFPYLNGEDLNSRPNQSPSRWVINFGELTEKEARSYNDCFRVVQEKVYSERATKDAKKYPRMVNEWWKFWNSRQELYKAIDTFDRTLIKARVTRTHAFVFAPKDFVFPDMIIVFAYDDNVIFSLLQSVIHESWAWKYGSTLKTDLRYSPTDCFQTFPFPIITNPQPLNTIGETYYEHRRQVMLARQEGLTKTYNRFHEAKETSDDIARLRALHVEMDNAVALAYGWGDLDLGHGFHETAQGMRYTLSEAARREVLARLLKLNHERWEEEQKVQMTNPKSQKPKSPTRKKDEGEGQGRLL